MSFHQALQTATAAEQQRFRDIPLIRAALSGRVTREQYLRFLAQAYHHVRHTVPLMMACGGRLGPHQAWLREQLAEYIRDELGHEEWILQDIQAAGGDPSLAREDAPMAETELMVAYAYDTIARGNPAGFLGMVFVLEGMSVLLASGAAASLEASLGLPKTAFTYLNTHGGLDVGHVEFFASLVERLEPADRAAVLHAARIFFRLYGDIFRAIGQETLQ